MEADFWKDRWSEGRTAWNQSEVHPVLVEHWDRQVVREGGAVFVPLCGKSVDMDWLAANGHRVTGCELSEIGVAEFFEDRGLVPDVTAQGDLTVYRAGAFEIWCGDFFDVTAAALEGVVAVYDRASLVALPPDMRRRYASHMATIAPADAPIFLLAFVYDAREMDGPPFSVNGDEIAALYGDAYDLDVVLDANVFSRNSDLAGRGLTSLNETLTVLRRRR